MAFEWGGSGTVAVGGANLEYASHGPAPDKAPTLVLLHEGLGSLGLWRDFPERLVAATGWGVAAYSRAGYGFSDPADLPRPLDYMTREAVEARLRAQAGVILAEGSLDEIMPACLMLLDASGL